MKIKDCVSLCFSTVLVARSVIHWRCAWGTQGRLCWQPQTRSVQAENTQEDGTGSISCEYSFATFVLFGSRKFILLRRILLQQYNTIRV